MASVGLTVFTLYMGFHITLGPIVTRAAHLMVVIPLAFLLYPARKRLPHGGPSPVDYFLAAAASAAVIVYRSGLTKGTGVLSGARRIDVTMSITRIPL